VSALRLPQQLFPHLHSSLLTYTFSFFSFLIDEVTGKHRLHPAFQQLYAASRVPPACPPLLFGVTMDMSTLLTTDMDPRSHAAASMLLLQSGGNRPAPASNYDNGSITSSEGVRTPTSIQASAGSAHLRGVGCHGQGQGHGHTKVALSSFAPPPSPTPAAAAGSSAAGSSPSASTGTGGAAGGTTTGGDPGGCCYLCGTYFTRKTNIEKHLTTRHGVGIGSASFPCEVCGVTFLLMEYTRRHEKNIHHHKRQYRCGICRKMCFGYRAKLVEHLRTAHGGKGVVCAACGCAFKDVTLLERHYKRKHARAADP